MERRQRALAERSSNPVDLADDGETQPEARRQPTLVSPDSFVLPPRAQMEKASSRFSRFLSLTFFLFVLLPTIVAGLFYAFFASDQFATYSSFAVRGNSSSSSSMDLGGLFSMGMGAADSETSDSFILQEFVQSREMVEALISEANFLEIYSRPSIDPYYRLDPSVSIEDVVDYWQMMSAVDFDVDTGIISLTIRAFRPADAEQITNKVIEKSEALVNDLSMRARNDSVKTAQREVSLAEARYAEARKSVAAYRGEEQEIDPTATAVAQQSVVTELQGQVAQREMELSALLTTMSDNSPRVVYVRNQLDALHRQITAERERLATAQEGQDQPVLTERLSRYEELLAEREFAEKAYISTLATLEGARVEALKQQRYLAVFVRGSAPESSQFPEGIRWSLILFGTLLLIWGVVALVSAAIRDRVV
ncbi:hypothetical protein L1787_23305 [Acuticoccus sp. M5D2P5]|uniref:hypothetical protein n=1 Tax=Acuticoccus kalidii TaxID=2910977 RepID=UPI001F405C32|nr:hypothetical protein [Acuticoccus kalidii]MCF3936326.1 hypothetical protein [Acuticoccus kalidii]